MKTRDKSAAGSRSLDRIELPQRAVEVERPARQIADEVRELPAAARSRERCPVHVGVEGEVALRDPSGRSDGKCRRADHLAKARVKPYAVVKHRLQASDVRRRFENRKR